LQLQDNSAKKLSTTCLIDGILDEVGTGHHDLQERVNDALAAGHHLEEGVLKGGLLRNLLAELLVRTQQNLLPQKKIQYNIKTKYIFVI
jgi:hypothetical protein